MNTTISIIMAVYNAKDTVGRMIDSLLAQTHHDFEIIIVDDGSTDGSSEICDSYADSDSRISVIHKSNEGVSAARQTGLDAAKGEYVIHADADDWIEPTMLEKLYKKAKEEDADVVFCDYFVNMANGTQTLIKQQPPLTPSKTLRALFQQLHGSCCNKLAKRACYNNFNITFPKGINYCEDLLTWVQLFQHQEVKISYVAKAFYHYVDNPKSATRKGSIEMLDQIKLFTKQMTDLLPKGEPDIDAYVKTLPIAPFQYAFQHKLVSNAESRQEYKRLRSVIWNDTKSLRWKLGYLMIEINLMWLAHKLIKL